MSVNKSPQPRDMVVMSTHLHEQDAIDAAQSVLCSGALGTGWIITIAEDNQRGYDVVRYRL